MLNTESNTPCWSRLLLHPQIPGTFTINIHPELAEFMRSIPETDQPSKALVGDSVFASDPDADWGYDGALKRLPNTTDGFMSFLIDPPCAKIFKKKPCSSCNGTSRNKRVGNDCLECDGGKQFYMDWKRLNPLCASLQLLCTIFLPYLYGTRTTSANTPQLLNFEMFSEPSMLGISATYSPALVIWLSRQSARLHQAEEAMMAVWSKILPTNIDASASFARRHMTVDPTQGGGWINITCPGDGSGLIPNQQSFRNTASGYDSAGYNIDHPAQQFAIISALAAIETKAREALCL